jgi:hypothetical protein
MQMMKTLCELCLIAVRQQLLNEKNIQCLRDGEFALLPNNLIDTLFSYSGVRKLHVASLRLFYQADIRRLEMNKSFDINDNNISVIITSELLRSFDNLISFKLHDIVLSNYLMSYLSYNLHNVIELDLHCCVGFGLEGLATIQYVRNLQVLNIEECKLTLDKWTLTLPNIKEIYVGGNDIKDTLISDIIISCGSRLMVLSVWGGNSSTEYFDPSVHSLPILQSLNVRWVSPSMLPMLDAMVPSLLKLIDLNCSHTDIDDDFMNIVALLPLKSIDVSSTKITYDSLKVLASIVTLEYIDVSYNNLSCNPNESMWSFGSLPNLKALSASQSHLCISSGRYQELLVNNYDGMMLNDMPVTILFPMNLRAINLNGNVNIPGSIISGEFYQLAQLKSISLSDINMREDEWDTMLRDKPR